LITLTSRSGETGGPFLTGLAPVLSLSKDRKNR